MDLRRASDAILVGINTILLDDPSLTVRQPGTRSIQPNRLRRIVLDSRARTPLGAKVVSDALRHLTTIVVSPAAPKRRVAALAKQVAVVVAPESTTTPGEKRGLNLRWLLKRLGSENVTSLLVEGGGETNASFLFQGLAQRIAFFYAPKILGGRDARRSVAGPGAATLSGLIQLQNPRWRRLGPDLFLEATVKS
jgi:diaminohydroxyphosphoribosylaminopyrimidine deaminase/5-amino-6-(5-phosphoribosylamino)uracil reductase